MGPGLEASYRKYEGCWQNWRNFRVKKKYYYGRYHAYYTEKAESHFKQTLQDINYNETKMKSRGSASSSATGITKEPEANAHKAASNPIMDQWLISIMSEDDKQEDPKAHSKPRIQKVPTRIRENEKNKKYFNPHVVSLGPYHHGDPLFEPMEKHKIMAARRFILYNQSVMKLEKTQVMERLYEKLMNVIVEARECYTADTMLELSDEGFARMMFLDGCFVLYVIEGMNKGNINLEVSTSLIPLIVRDIFLLENQLPFVVLNALMSLRFDSIQKVKEKIMKFIDWEVLLPMGLSFFIARRSLIGSRNDVPLHLLDVLRTMLLGSPPSEPDKKNRYRQHNFGSVMELKEAGIRFKKSETRYLTEIRFEEYFFFPRLLLPPMVINDATITQLLNLTAFEMFSDTHSGCGVTSYICFLDSLINHGADVKELRSMGILHHALGSDEEVARLFNEWPIEGMNDLTVYIKVKERIYSHRHNSVKVSIARWLHMYFKSPWTAISFVAAVLLLFFTCIQTAFAVFPRH